MLQELLLLLFFFLKGFILNNSNHKEQGLRMTLNDTCQLLSGKIVLIIKVSSQNDPKRFLQPKTASHKYLLESRVPCMKQTQARLGPTCPNNSAVKQISWSSKCSFLMQMRQCRALIYCWCSV